MNDGLVYRHDTERWNALQGLSGTLYSSPRRNVVVGGVEYVEELIQPTLEPIKLTAQDVTQLQSLARLWDQLIGVQCEVVARGLRGEEPWRAVAEQIIPPALRSLAVRNCNYDIPRGPFVRLDMVRTPTGLQVVDINSTRPAGIGDATILVEAYRQAGFRGITSPASAFTAVVWDCFTQWRKHDAEDGHLDLGARIAMVSDTAAGDWSNFQVLAAILRREPGVELVEVIETVPEPTDTRFNCIIRGRIKFGHPQFDRLLALPPEKFCVISPLGRRWIGDKRWFRLLQEEPARSLLYERLGFAEAAIILAAIPETGIFTEPGFVLFPNGLVRDVQSLNNNDWIVKPATGSSGKGIVMGRSMSKWKWQNYCSQPQIRGALLQRYFRIKEPVTIFDRNGEPTIQRYYIKYGVFMLGGRFGGVEVMARPTALVHGARDTYLTTVMHELLT